VLRITTNSVDASGSQLHASVNVADFLLSGKTSSCIAILTLQREYSYGELQYASRAISRYLTEHGGRKGDRVLLVADNSFFWIASYLGILAAGLVAVPLPPAISTGDLQHIAESTEPRFGFLQSTANEWIAGYLQTVPAIAIVSDAKTNGAADFQDLLRETDTKPLESALTETQDLAALMFTSGSTGKPRGVMISHGNIIANTRSIVSNLNLSADDRIMAVLPFHYCFGASLLHTHLSVGASVVIDLRFMYPDKVLQRMIETDCTGFAGVPSHFQILLRKSSLPKMKFPHLRYVQQAGGHLAPAFVRELIATLPSSEIFLMYGQTEATARLSSLSPTMVAAKPASIGQGISGVKLRVLNDRNQDVQPGEEGEIVAQGNNIALGYWRDPEGTASTFRNGKLHTGDIATVDLDGYIYMLNRARDFIKCGGERISCQALEEQLLECDELLEVAIVGVPDDVLGEAIQAYVVSRDGDSESVAVRVRQFCEQNIPFKRAPKFIVPLKALPKSNTGKVLKAALRQL
jgi:long-chain acyl-CoA synthetase